MKALRIDPTRHAASESIAAVSSGCERRVLIVEDNYFVAHQCRNALIEAGYEVVDIVVTADDAVRAAMDHRPAFVLMDIYLPGQRDGIDASIEILRRFGIRSVFASALTDAVIKERAQSAQPLAWLAKPFSDRKLVATVETALQEAGSLQRADA
jgi:two-component system, response regulator PdtaR